MGSGGGQYRVRRQEMPDRRIVVPRPEIKLLHPVILLTDKLAIGAIYLFEKFPTIPYTKGIAIDIVAKSAVNTAFLLFLCFASLAHLASSISYV